MSELTNNVLALLEDHNKIKPYLIGMVRAQRMTAKGAPTFADRSSGRGFADLSDNS
jgi:hypothetical protein